jgi:hypothetical protein
MGTLVGILLVAVAGATVVGVLWVIMREPHVHEEYYIPPPKAPTSETSAPSTTDHASVSEIVTETIAGEPPAQDKQDTTA